MRSKIEFLTRLFDMQHCKVALLQYLKDEFIISDDQMQSLLAEHHTQHASKISFMLEDLYKKSVLQLVSYEWTILPKEYMNLTLVTKNSKKEFVHTT